MRKLVAALVLTLGLLAPQLSLAAFSVTDSGLRATTEAGYGVVDGDNFNIAFFIGAYVIAPVIGLLGLLFFCLTIYAGMLWMTAAGEPKRIEKAKEILRAAVIGAVIVIAAYAITNTIFGALAPSAGV